MAHATQGNLFTILTSHADPEVINSFTLDRSSFRFHTWPDSRNASDPVIYFVQELRSSGKSRITESTNQA